MICGTIFHSLRDLSSSTLIYRIGFDLDAIGIYVLSRWIIRTTDDIARAARYLIPLLVSMTIGMTIEWNTAYNIYEFTGSDPDTWIKDCRIRPAGPIGNPGLAGSWAAGLAALYLSIFMANRAASAVLGLALCTALTVLSASSGPIVAYAFVILGWLLWPVRHKLTEIRYVFLALIVIIHFARVRPGLASDRTSVRSYGWDGLSPRSVDRCGRREFWFVVAAWDERDSRLGLRIAGHHELLPAPRCSRWNLDHGRIYRGSGFVLQGHWPHARSDERRAAWSRSSRCARPGENGLGMGCLLDRALRHVHKHFIFRERSAALLSHPCECGSHDGSREAWPQRRVDTRLGGRRSEWGKQPQEPGASSRATRTRNIEFTRRESWGECPAMIDRYGSTKSVRPWMRAEEDEGVSR